MSRCLTAPAPNPWTTRTVHIASIEFEIPEVATYRLIENRTIGPQTYEFIPGQFNMLYMPGIGESAISMSGNPQSPDAWIHTVRVAGHVTKMLSRLKPADTLGLRGPFGAGWPVQELEGRNPVSSNAVAPMDVMIVVGGLGMAPLRPLIYHIINHRERFGRVWLIYGARSPEVLLYTAEFESWRSHQIDVQLTVDRGTGNWNGQIGVVTLLMDRMRLPSPDQTHLLICGPEVMMKYAAISGQRLGVADQRIWVSLERNMQCAVGFCGHCQLGPEFICKDGPVLRYDRVKNLMAVEQL
jgi:NAD(P)H-flavin reductase